MRSTIRWIVGLALLVLIATGSPVEAQKKPDADKDLDKNSDKMIKAGTVSGKVMAVYEDKKKIRLQVGFPVLDPAKIQQLAQARAEMAQARDPNAYRAAQIKMAQTQMSLYKIENKEIEVQASDEVVVRMARPKEDFDEKGKPKRYTKKELQEMRGTDKKLPGYNADFGDITTDQIIQVSLVRKKGAPVGRPKRKGKDDAEADLLGDYSPQASLIVILREPPRGK